MGAIYGFIGKGDNSLLSAMGERLSHRGTRVNEWSPSPGVFLGQRNFDFEDAAEPSQGEAMVAANASLYNRGEIAELLAEEGVSIQGHSTVDLVQKAFEKLGPDCLRLFNGDFVFAVWDQKQGRLLLARDPVGTRSVYYWIGADFFAFASEYKALLVCEQLPVEPDLEMIQYYNASKYLPTGKTLLKGVASLPSAHWLEVSQGQVELHAYWDIAINPRDIEESLAEKELKDLFSNALEKRLEGVEDLGVALSGGVDSAAVVAVMRKLCPDRPIKTFTIGSSLDDPEIQLARIVADKFGTEHRELVAEPEELKEHLPSLVWHLEDPVGRTEAYLYYRLMKLATEYISVVFVGSASDGLFAGMPKHKLIKLMQILPPARGPLEEFYHYTQTSYPPETLVGKLMKRIYYGNGELSSPKVIGAPPFSTPNPLPDASEGMLNRVLRSGVLGGVSAWMPKVEKTHMAHGIEVRAPFTDPAFIRYSFELPEHLKMRGLTEKYILRQALAKLVPEEVVKRPKFPQRMGYDNRLSDALESLSETYLNASSVKQRGFFSPEEIDTLRRRSPGKAYGSNTAMRLWSAIMTEIWAQIYLDRRGEALA